MLTCAAQSLALLSGEILLADAGLDSISSHFLAVHLLDRCSCSRPAAPSRPAGQASAMARPALVMTWQERGLLAILAFEEQSLLLGGQ